jgi:hypothetical protein
MRRTNFQEWKNGEEDNHGNKIAHIRFATKDYIIYDSVDRTLHHDEIDGLIQELNHISEEMSTVVILFDPRSSKASKADKVYYQVALAWQLCFNKEPEFAKTILQNLIQKLISDGRTMYIAFVAGSFAGLSIIAALLIHFSEYFSSGNELALISKMFILGALGGLISVLIKIKDLTLDPQSKIINCISGISRTVVAGVSSFVFYLIYKSEFIFSFAKGDHSQEIYTLLLLSFFMGFSERFIPDFSNKISGALEQKNN